MWDRFGSTPCAFISLGFSICPFGSIQNYLKVPDWLCSLRKTGCWDFQQGFMLDQIFCLRSAIGKTNSSCSFSYNLYTICSNQNGGKFSAQWNMSFVGNLPCLIPLQRGFLVFICLMCFSFVCLLYFLDKKKIKG